jgi:hypothetical protein
MNIIMNDRKKAKGLGILNDEKKVTRGLII